MKIQMSAYEADEFNLAAARKVVKNGLARGWIVRPSAVPGVIYAPKDKKKRRVR